MFRTYRVRTKYGILRTSTSTPYMARVCTEYLLPCLRPFEEKMDDGKKVGKQERQTLLVAPYI